MNEHWKSNLNAWDAELLLMVENLTEKGCEPKNGGDHYFFEADYSKHNDPDYIFAIWDAIRGRLGNRLLEIGDDPERQTLFVRVMFSDEKLPGFAQSETKRPRPIRGLLYRERNSAKTIRAIQVGTEPETVNRMMDFVGTGQMEFPEGLAKFHFLNACGSVWKTATETDYIVHVSDGLFNVIPEKEFEKQYMPISEVGKHEKK